MHNIIFLFGQNEKLLTNKTNDKCVSVLKVYKIICFAYNSKNNDIKILLDYFIF